MSETQGRKAVVSYWADALLTGGGSILLCLPFIIFGNDRAWPTNEGNLYIGLAILLNIPHFLVTYRIVYRSRETILRYRSASLYVPAALIAYGVWALSRVDTDPLYLGLMATVAGIYLAWHYTGQAWGMIASFAFLDGTPIAARERRLIKWALHLLLAWHVTWFCHFGKNQPWIVPNSVGKLYGVLSVLTLVSVGLSVAAAVLFVRRTGRKPSLRMVLPWLAIYVWYAAMARTPFALYFVQMAHAVQYLVFPGRVEANRLEAAKKTHKGLRLAGYGVALVVVSWCINDVPAALIEAKLLNPFIGAPAAQALPLFIIGFLNIHHFFTDSCIWKISNPTVRRELFAHVLPPPDPTAPPPPPPAGPTPRELRRRRLRLVVAAASLALLCGGVEAVVRLRGLGAFKPIPPNPNEIVRLEPDARRGWRNKPGTWTYPAYAPGLPEIQVTINPDGARATSAAPTQRAGEVLVLGCSFTHGQGLSDHETFAWQLQERLPEATVLNHGTNGYGTYQSLILFDELSKTWARPPRAVIYCFGDFHAVRNVGWYLWLLGLQARDSLGYGKAPYVTQGAEDLLHHDPESYASWPLRTTLATVAHAELAYMRARTAERFEQREAVTKRLLTKLNELCTERGTTLLVAVLTNSPPYASFLEANGIAFVRVNHPQAKDPSTRVPGEGIHPNAAVNAYWAEKVLPPLTQLLDRPRDE